MGIIKGMTVTLMDKMVAGIDPFGRPNYRVVAVPVDNVIVAPAGNDDVVNALQLFGKKAVYTLGIPKGDSHNWLDREVIIFGQRFRTFGPVVQGMPHLMPLAWDRKVSVERYE